MTFNIGNQTGGIINNVGGDQTIHGDQHGEAVTSLEARKAARDLREAVERTGLPDDATARRKVRRKVQDIDAEMRSAEPDKSKVARYLDGLTRVIDTAGDWARAGAAIVGPLRILATWLGRLGLPILSLLPALS